MSNLPERADLDQLRRRARELLRAAVAGERKAVAALSAVAARPTLAAAQLAIAREHGFRSWPALRAEVQSRQQPIEWRPLADADQPPPGTAPGRWSFAGTETVTVEEGELTPRILVAGPDSAFLEASLAVAPEVIGRARGVRSYLAKLSDVTITDDQGSTFTLQVSASYHREPGPEQRLWCEMTCHVHPVPEGGRRWLDVHGKDASVARLRPADPVPVQVYGPDPAAASPAERELLDLASGVLRGYLDPARRDTPEFRRWCRQVLVRTAELRAGGLADSAGSLPDQLTRLCAALIGRRRPTGLTSGWHGVLDAADRVDGPRAHLETGTALPAADGISLRLDTLASWPSSWDLYLQATPGWWIYSTDGQHKRDVVSVSAEDDLGGLYIASFGGSSSRPGHEQVKLEFRPRLDPRARLLRLTLVGQTQQVTAQVSRPPDRGVTG